MNVIIPEAFTGLFLSGLWWPNICKSKTLKYSYRLYLFTLWTITTQITASAIYSLFVLKNNYEDRAETLYIILVSFNAQIKCVNFVIRTNAIERIVNRLTTGDYKPQTDEEIQIFTNFNSISRSMGVFSIGLGIFAVTLMCSAPFIFFEGRHKMPIRVFTDHYDGDMSYYFYYAFQIITLQIIYSWNITNDILLSGFMIQVCAQLQLVSHRLQKLPMNVKSMLTNGKISRDQIHRYEHWVIKKNVQHHLDIIRLLREIELNFGPCICVQYCTSTFLLTMTISELSVIHSHKTRSFMVSIYMIAMMFEWFSYCWFGNEIIAKSLQFNDIIFRGNWTELHIKTLKELLIVMMKTSTPISIKFGPLVTLSNKSYIRILRLSYSAYNVFKLFSLKFGIR